MDQSKASNDRATQRSKMKSKGSGMKRVVVFSTYFLGVPEIGSSAFTAVLLKVRFVWDVMSCQLVSTSATSYKSTLCNSSKYLNLLPRHLFRDIKQSANLQNAGLRIV
jgi:hypothetical protein